MSFAGLDKRTDPNDLSDAKSPDTTNMFLYKGQVGKMGPRLGKTFTNTQAYGDRIVGAFAGTQPNGKPVFFIPLANGNINVTPLLSTNPTARDSGSLGSAFLAATLTETITFPDVTVKTGSTTFTSQPGNSPELQNMIANTFVNISDSSLNPTKEGVKYSIKIGSLSNGAPKYTYSFSDVMGAPGTGTIVWRETGAEGLAYSFQVTDWGTAGSGDKLALSLAGTWSTFA